jgi:hypothetical protein
VLSSVRLGSLERTDGAHFRDRLAPFFDYHDLAAHHALNNRAGSAMKQKRPGQNPSRRL